MTTLPYKKLRDAFTRHPIRTAEVPVEHAISLPLPTLRWGRPAIAGFSAPALRQPGRPLELGAPDRWWLLDMSGQRLLAYATTAAIPFDGGLSDETVEVDRTGQSIDNINETLHMLDEAMDRVIEPFLAGQPGDAAQRSDVMEILTLAVTKAVLPRYRALCPDFLGWLDGETAGAP